MVVAAVAVVVAVAVFNAAVVVIVVVAIAIVTVYFDANTTDQNETRMENKAHCAHELTYTCSLHQDPTRYTFYFICRFVIISWLRHSTCQINFTANGWSCCWWQLTAASL